MVFIFIAFISIVIYYIFLIINYEKERKRLEDVKEYRNKTEDKSSCPPNQGGIHKWSYHPVTQRLTCIKCNFVAGTDGNIQ